MLYSFGKPAYSREPAGKMHNLVTGKYILNSWDENPPSFARVAHNELRIGAYIVLPIKMDLILFETWSATSKLFSHLVLAALAGVEPATLHEGCTKSTWQSLAWRHDSSVISPPRTGLNEKNCRCKDKRFDTKLPNKNAVNI